MRRFRAAVAIALCFAASALRAAHCTMYVVDPDNCTMNTAIALEDKDLVYYNSGPYGSSVFNLWECDLEPAGSEPQSCINTLGCGTGWVCGAGQVVLYNSTILSGDDFNYAVTEFYDWTPKFSKVLIAHDLPGEMCLGQGVPIFIKARQGKVPRVPVTRIFYPGNNTDVADDTINQEISVEAGGGISLPAVPGLYRFFISASGCGCMSDAVEFDMIVKDATCQDPDLQPPDLPLSDPANGRPLTVAGPPPPGDAVDPSAPGCAAP